MAAPDKDIIAGDDPRRERSGTKRSGAARGYHIDPATGDVVKNTGEKRGIEANEEGLYIANQGKDQDGSGNLGGKVDDTGPGGDKPPNKDKDKDKLPPWFEDWVKKNKGKLTGPTSGVLATPGLRKLLRTLAENGATKAQLNAFANAGPGDLASLTGPSGNFSSLTTFLADNPESIKDVAKWLSKNEVGPNGQGGTTDIQNDAFNEIPGLKDYYTAEFGGVIAPPGSPYAGQLVDAETGLPSGTDLSYLTDHIAQLDPATLAKWEELYETGQMRGNMLAAYRAFTGLGNATPLPGEEGYISTERRYEEAGLPVPGSEEWQTMQGGGGPFSQEYYDATSSAYGTGLHYNVPKPPPVTEEPSMPPDPMAGPSYQGGFDAPFFDETQFPQSL